VVDGLFLGSFEKRDLKVDAKFEIETDGRSCRRGKQGGAVESVASVPC
jgi:hypothetical protein